jgi:hypothetical protein
VNRFIYEEIANLRSYILLAVAILLATSFSVNNSIISVYGQQFMANNSMVQINPGLESSEDGQLTTYGPSANDLDTPKEQQSGTNTVGSKENAAQMPHKQGTDEETLRNLAKADDNDVFTELQSEKPQNKNEQNREGQQEFDKDVSNNADSGDDDVSNNADSGDDVSNNADSGDDVSNNADSGDDVSGKENDDDIPFELPFP